MLWRMIWGELALAFLAVIADEEESYPSMRRMRMNGDWSNLGSTVVFETRWLMTT